VGGSPTEFQLVSKSEEILPTPLAHPGILSGEISAGSVVSQEGIDVIVVQFWVLDELLRQKILLVRLVILLPLAATLTPLALLDELTRTDRSLSNPMASCLRLLTRIQRQVHGGKARCLDQLSCSPVPARSQGVGNYFSYD
jgi:hypothetical protein